MPRRDVERREGRFECKPPRPRFPARFFDLLFADMVGFAVMEDAHHDAIDRVPMDGA